MSKSNIITFITISIILLVGIFFIFIFIGFLSGPNTNFIQQKKGEQRTNSDLQQVKQTKGDPLITSSKEIYYSFFNANDAVRGNKKAELFILEFGDFQCPYSLQIQEILNKILDDYKDKVSLVWKDFPNPIHLQARSAALAARCAQEQNKFWQYHDYLFANQDNLSRKLYNKIALELNLNLEQFNNCLDTQKYIKVIGQGLIDGQKLEVDATPYLFIGNTRVDSVVGEEKLRAIIRRELGE